MEAVRCVKLEKAGYSFLWNSCLRLPWPLGAYKVGPGILRVVVCSKVRKRSSGTQAVPSFTTRATSSQVNAQLLHVSSSWDIKN